MLANYSFDERCDIDTIEKTQQNCIQFRIDDAAGTPKAMVHDKKPKKLGQNYSCIFCTLI